MLVVSSVKMGGWVVWVRRGEFEMAGLSRYNSNGIRQRHS